MVKTLLETSHHVLRNRRISIVHGANSQVTPTDTDLHELTRSAVIVANEPDVHCDSPVLNFRLEVCADIDLFQGTWETLEILKGEIVLVACGAFAIRCRNPDIISNPHYVVSSRHVFPQNLIID